MNMCHGMCFRFSETTWGSGVSFQVFFQHENLRDSYAVWCISFVFPLYLFQPVCFIWQCKHSMYSATFPKQINVYCKIIREHMFVVKSHHVHLYPAYPHRYYTKFSTGVKSLIMKWCSFCTVICSYSFSYSFSFLKQLLSNKFPLWMFSLGTFLFHYIP